MKATGKGRRRRPGRLERPRQPPRSILPADRKRIVRELNLRCRPGERGTVSFAALRMRAIVLLTGGAALRIAEVCKLDAHQVLEDAKAPRWKLRSLVYVRPEQSKGRRVGDEQWDSAGTILVSDVARSALRAYLAEAKRRGYIAWPPKKGEPLFVAVRGNWRSGNGRHRLSVRTLQQQWMLLQHRAGLDTPYHFHCLRHDAMTRACEALNNNVKALAIFGRCSVQTALRYVHVSPQQLIALRNQLSLG